VASLLSNEPGHGRGSIEEGAADGVLA